jgi:membrane protein required for colicin V production
MLIVLGMSTIFGAIKGLSWQIASLASILVSYVVSYRYRFQVAEMIEAKPPWNMFLAMLILYVGTGFVIWVGFRLMSGFIDSLRMKDFDRHLGALFGFGKGLIFCLLITMFAMSLLGPNQRSAICKSRSGYYIATALDKGAGILPREISEVVGPYLAKLDNTLKEGGVMPGGIAQPEGEFWPSGTAGNTQQTGNTGFGLPSLNDLLRPGASSPGLPIQPATNPQQATNQQPSGQPGWNWPLGQPSAPPVQQPGFPSGQSNGFSPYSYPDGNLNRAAQPSAFFPR